MLSTEDYSQWFEISFIFSFQDFHIKCYEKVCSNMSFFLCNHYNYALFYHNLIYFLKILKNYFWFLKIIFRQYNQFLKLNSLIVFFFH